MKTPQKPITALSVALGIKNEIWFKFENKHHFGSHKGRSIPPLIDEYVKQGINSFVISSSGNAALAAMLTIQSHNKNKPAKPLLLKIFVGENIEKNKFTALNAGESDKISIEQVKNPKQSALNFSKEQNATWLRGSTDPFALIGYESLSAELSKIENLSAVFFAASSGTAAEGTFIGLNKLGAKAQIHIVQTDSCHPLVNFWLEKNNKAPEPDNTEKSLADAIVDKIGHRKESVAKILNESGGAAWIIDNAQLKKTLDIIKKEAGEDFSPNGALAVAGLISAVKAGHNLPGAIVCIIGGN